MVYQLTLVGFNGATSDTDHLIKWAIADSLEQVNEHVAKLGLELQEEPEVLDLHHDELGMDYDWREVAV